MSRAKAQRRQANIRILSFLIFTAWRLGAKISSENGLEGEACVPLLYGMMERIDRFQTGILAA